MKLPAAIKYVIESNRYLWLRPVSWRGHGQAYTITEGKLFRVPHLKAVPGLTGRISELMGDWEVVDPATVNTENL